MQRDMSRTWWRSIMVLLSVVRVGGVGTIAYAGSGAVTPGIIYACINNSSDTIRS